MLIIRNQSERERHLVAFGRSVGRVGRVLAARVEPARLGRRVGVQRLPLAYNNMEKAKGWYQSKSKSQRRAITTAPTNNQQPTNSNSNSNSNSNNNDDRRFGKRNDEVVAKGKCNTRSMRNLNGFICLVLVFFVC